MRLGGAITLCLVLLSSARADEPPESEARKAYMHAQSLFDGGQYSPALAEYQRSYALASYPAILYRIGLCQDLLGRREEALASYRKFLTDAPESERRDAVETRIHQLELAAMPSAPPAPPPPVEKPPELRWLQEEMARQKTEQARQRAEQERLRADTEHEQRMTAASKTGFKLRTAGAVLIPLGLVITGASFGLIADADPTTHKISDHDPNMPWTTDDRGNVDHLFTDSFFLVAFTTIGAAVTVAGIAMLSVGTAKRSRALARARGASR